jgi:hypothetical protein
MKKKSNQVEHAVARMPEAFETVDEVIAAGNTHIGDIKNNPDLPNAPDVATTIAQWDAEHAKLVAADKKVTDADLAAEKARTDRATILRQCKLRARGCVNAISIHAAGSEALIKAYAMGVAEKLGSPLEKVPEDPKGLKVIVAGEANWTWTTHRGNHGYSVQWATDASNPATYSPPIHCTKGRFQLTGQTPGATLHLRLAALDSRLPNGQTTWTAWVSVVVSL